MSVWKCLFAWIYICINLAHAGDIIHKYTLSIDADLSTLYVQAEFGQTDFYYLYAGSNFTARHTKNMHFLSQKADIYYPQKEEIELNLNAAGQTLYYEFDLSSALGTQRWSAARMVGDDISAPPDLWLWCPYSMQVNEYIEVTFNFPKNIRYSVPWTPIGKNRYRIPATPIKWASAAVFGTFSSDTVTVENCKIAIAFMDGVYKTSQAELKRWLEGAARSVCNVYRSFPVNNLQVLVYPGRPANEPVPFGMVVRGGGPTVNFYIDPSRPLEEFIADWTATHELSHCLLPMIRRGDAWLSEGLATYYQYILMGRDGRLNEQETWQRIYNGFRKGMHGSKGKTLDSTAEQMHKLRAFRYVYWSGAAMFLKADIALRRQSNGKKNLDRVLKKIQTDILPLNKNWPGREMMAIMDSLSATSVFTDIYRTHINSSDFPVDDRFWAQLGVKTYEQQVYLDNNAEMAWIRKDILKNVP